MGHVPTTNLNALYANTTSGTVANPAVVDAAIQDIVAAVDGNYDASLTIPTLTGDVTNTGNDVQINAGVIVNADINAAAAIAATKIANGGVSDAEFQRLAGVTSAIQTQIDNKAPLAHVGSNGTLQHAIADASNAGFMSVADYLKLASIITTSLPTFDIPADVPLKFGTRFKIVLTSATDTLDIYES